MEIYVNLWVAWERKVLTFCLTQHFLSLFKYKILFLLLLLSHFSSVQLCATPEKVMAPHSSTLAWKIPWMEEPGRLQSMGSLSQTRLSDFTFTFHFHALEEEMATHSSVLAWRIPGMGEPGGLPSVGSHRVGHDWSDLVVVVVATLLIAFLKCFTQALIL